jgi:hypothetical protein
MHDRFHKEILRMAGCAENRMAELEVGGVSGRGKVLCMMLKCWWGKNVLLGVEEMGEVEGFIQKQDLEAKKED